MYRVVSLLAASLLLGTLWCGAGAQTATSDPAKSPLQGQNPILSQLAVAAPGNVSRVENELRRITAGALEGGLRGGNPTPAEEAQMKANPTFAAAYERSPAHTLALLRWVNDTLRQKAGTSGR
ncbi:MAG: hypothetical protein AB7F35_10465 [Acetobacteraceae bacterium]